MNNRSRLRQLLIFSLLLWLTCAGLVFLFTYAQLSYVVVAVLLCSVVLAALVSLLTLNQSQKEVAESNKLHSRTKRLVQEHQLKIDRFEYDAKKAAELRRIVLNSTQEKDHSLRNMALALDHAMDEIVELTDSTAADVQNLIRARAESMKQYAQDLQALARLELKSELPEYAELNFLDELEHMLAEWNQFGKSRKVKIKLESREDEMPVVSDRVWIENLLSRLVYALIRMNHDTHLDMHLIGYLDAEMGDSLRVSFTIRGRALSEDQLQRLTTEYVSIIENGQEIGPGLTFVVARRMAQLLNGSIDVSSDSEGMEVLVVLPRNPGFNETEQAH